MSLSKLQRQLANDLKKNPKKAALLALLAVLCIWFWIPLVFKHDPVPASASARTPAPAAIAPTAAASPHAAPAEPAIAWQDLDQQITIDPQMKPAELGKLAEARNPFGMTAIIAEQKRVAEEQEHAKHEQEQPAVAEPPHESTPDEVGLVLTSTLVGSNKRAALISGRVYEEGSQIKADDGSQFRLAHVDAQRVLLERAGHKYPLEIKRRTASGRAEIRPLSP
jgi:hypothetical protein